MKFSISRTDVWAATIDDRPGAMAEKLAALAAAGAKLGFIIARRMPEQRGSGVLMVTPLKGAKQVKAAEEAGFQRTESLHSVRAEGPNEPGGAGKLAKAIGDAGINMRGFSAAVLGTRFVAHIGVDTAEDEAAVVKLLSEL